MNQITEILKANCAPFIEELNKCTKGSFLLRGSKFVIESYEKQNSRLNDRRPLNTPQETHDLVNSFFFEKFGWNIRNGVFCYGWNINSEDSPYDLGYGVQYLMFPIGKFEFVYNPEHFDFFQFVLENKIDRQILEKQIFKDKSLREAINTGEKSNEFSHEISVHVPSFYLINIDYAKEIVNFIWPD